MTNDALLAYIFPYKNTLHLVAPYKGKTFAVQREMHKSMTPFEINCELQRLKQMAKNTLATAKVYGVQAMVKRKWKATPELDAEVKKMREVVIVTEILEVQARYMGLIDWEK